MTKKKLTIEHVMRQRPAMLKLYRALPRVGVVVLLGFRGEGKTATAMSIMEAYHDKYNYGGAVLYFPRRLKSKLPAWVKLVDDMEKLPANAVCIIDEAAQEAHARQFQSASNLGLTELADLSRQRKQLIIFITHHSRKLDLNLITDSDLILYKRPTEAHYLFERPEVQPITRKVLDEFKKIKGKSQPWAFIVDLHRLKLGWLKVRLPSFWCDEISTWVGLVGKSRKATKTKGKEKETTK